MDPRYNLNDIVYYVNDYKVIKCVVDSVIVKEDRNGFQTIYTVSAYKKKDAKSINCIGANLVNDLKIAKESALTNWKRITEQVQTQLENLTDEAFESND
jgi:hydroxymethylpyrimidine/phosphomethylpyrimidine kinase